LLPKNQEKESLKNLRSAINHAKKQFSQKEGRGEFLHVINALFN
jgi:hypothetical protein